MTRRVHLVRHGEVDNPGGLVYGTLEGFPLTERGEAMATAAADALIAMDRPVSHLRVSPLLRTRQSAEPIARAFSIEPEHRPNLVEASSRLEGKAYDVSLTILKHPSAWRYLINPFRPSWGEPFRDVARRMIAEVEDAFGLEGDADVVLVSHQLPIWVVHRVATGKSLAHDPRRRRCALSSITSFESSLAGLHEVGYLDPTAGRPIEAPL